MNITTKKDFFTLLKGATFLASGGGGPYSLAKLIVETYIKDDTLFQLDLIDPSTLAESDWGCIAAGMAAPSKGIGLTPQDIVEPTVNAVNAMDTLIKDVLSKQDVTRFGDFTQFNILIPIEVGAINVVIPLMTAYLLDYNISVIDGDSAGRAVPTIDLTTFSSSQDVMPNMATSAGKDFKFTTLSLDSYKDLNIAYSQLIGAGLIGIDTGLSLAPMNGVTIQNNNLIYNTLSEAYAIGKIMENDKDTTTKISEIASCLSSSGRSVKLLCTGKVITYTTKTIDDNDVGYMSVETSDNRIFTISIQNETITGQFEDEICIAVTGPDSICYLSTRDKGIPDGEIYDNTLIQEKMAKGEDVEIHIIAIQADSVVSGNDKLMNSWRNAYKTARYYGAYNSQLWASSSEKNRKV